MRETINGRRPRTRRATSNSSSAEGGRSGVMRTEILVNVSNRETRIAMPGRYVVLMPEANNVGVSRKIEDRSERERLRKLGDRIAPENFGLILRTECEGRTEQELRADIQFLQQQWGEITRNAKKQ